MVCWPSLAISGTSQETAMWMFKTPMSVADAAAGTSRLAVRLPLRLRDRVAPDGLLSSDGFELEGVALVHAIGVFAIADSKFGSIDRDRLQDRFTVAYAEQILRMRLTQNLFKLLPPLEAVEAGNAMRGLRLKSHDQLDLFNLRDFLWSRLSVYQAGDLEDTINGFLTYLEASRRFDVMFSLAVFITDSLYSMREHVDVLSRTVHLV